MDVEEVTCRANLFRFEAWWILKETFEAEVRKSWESFRGDVLNKLNNLKVSLGEWAKVIKH